MATTCPKCGADQPYPTDFCLSCGLPLQTRCPRCGAPVRPGAQRCPQCGSRLTDPLSFEELFGAPTTLQGRYTIEKRLKRGHATAVYLARDQALGRRCVIKEFHPRRLPDDFERDEAQRSFHAEAARWAQVRHPRLARIQDMFIQAGRSYLVMEWVRGHSLRRLIADPRMEIDELTAVAWALQICDALAFLHGQTPPLIFGDLNPRHVMITTEGRVKLIDFGLSAWFTPWDQGPPRYRGSPGYAAPEQRERWEADARSDLYALGGLLYHMLTRQAPNQPPIRLNELPPALAQIIRRARQRAPERRFPSAQAMRRALAKAAPGVPSRPKEEAPQEPIEPSSFAAPTRPAASAIVAHPTLDPWADLRSHLAEQARSDWLRAVRRFYGGQTLDQLQREIARLAEGEQDHIAQQIQAALERAEELLDRGEMEDALGRQVLFARWLAEIKATPPDPEFIVRPQRFTFGGLTRRVAKRTALRIRNTGQGVLVGEVESTLPWLEVRDARFSCRPGEEARVIVVAHGKQLPLEGERAPRALRIITNRGATWIPALASLIVPSLAVQPTSIDFGQVRHGQEAQAEIVIANQGGGEIQGAVRSTVTWLSVTPRQFQIGAEEGQKIHVRFHGDLAPPGVEEAADVLVVDSDYGQARLSVRWRWAEPEMVLAPEKLAWGARERGSEAEITLTITNSGTAPLEGRLLSRCDWIDVSPERFSCAPGESQSIRVHAHLEGLPAGVTALGEALVIESNAGRKILATSVEILAPVLQVKPISLDLGEAEWGEVRRGSLRISNQGTIPLRANLKALLPWLHLEPTEIECAPGKSARVVVEARTEEMLQGGDWQAAPGIHIESNAGARDVPISLLVYKPEMQVEPEFLNFGVIPREGVGELTLYISNPGTAPLAWSLSSEALWLEVTMPQGTTPPGETSQVHLYAYGLAVPADQDEAQMALIIESNAGERTVQGAVAIARPQLWVTPPLLDLGTSANYVPVEDILSLFNRGVGELSGTIRASVPWLTVEPDTFQIPTGGQQPITVRATPEGLREGENVIEGALEVISNAGQEQVDIRIKIQLSGQLVVGSSRLTWTLGETPPILRLKNTGYAPISVTVHPQAEWLRVNRDRLVVKRGRGARVELAIREEALPANDVLETEIVLEQPDQTTRIPVVVTRGE
ncbi:MAG: protein kinase [Chloroflexi bacterium]|nr:protein kinase [Chloroflexota bacterium]